MININKQNEPINIKSENLSAIYTYLLAQPNKKDSYDRTINK